MTQPAMTLEQIATQLDAIAQNETFDSRPLRAVLCMPRIPAVLANACRRYLNGGALDTDHVRLAELANMLRSGPSADSTFMVGYTAEGFAMLGYAGTLVGDRMLGSDLRGYVGIERTEPFDPMNPAHAEFIGFRAYAVNRDAKRLAAKKAVPA